ncbi:MAG: Mut7-C RNAse domain-containing protein, partial [Pseudomonadota bacterium]
EGRVILSRDTKLLRVRGLPEYLLITDDSPGKQLRQVFTHFKLELAEEQFFTRCLRCNQMLIHVSPEEVKPKVPSFVLTIHQDFFSCPQCGRVYWKGTHHLRMKEMIRRLLRLPEGSSCD